MVYSLKYTKIFKKQIENVKKKNKVLMKELVQKVKKLYDSPHSGKPLKYRLSNFRSLRVKGKYRLIYMVDENEREVTLVAFGHREDIYKLMLLSFEDGRKE